MIEIEIDGKQLEVEPGSMIIEAADNAGIWIPRFCYHKKLSIAANCRMCLVEVEKVGKPLPACATPVTAGMKVTTQSNLALAAQKSVMEFLLINHPLDCPICDQGGECELQDIAMGYGRDVSRFNEGKRSVDDENVGPLIATEMTRCIHCTRCVRFGQEIAGMPELGTIGRGDTMEIKTFITQSLQSELSGNVIDLCPVGALTSKPFRFKARTWELRQHDSIAAHDCVGSNIYLHTMRNQAMRVVPRSNEAINEVWLSDRDRFSYEGLNSAERVTTPLIKCHGKWQQVAWNKAIEHVVTKLNEVKQVGAEQIGAVASPNSTVEELYLLQKLMRGLGSHNIDHRLRETDMSDQHLLPMYPKFALAVNEIEQQEAILLIGSNVQREQPIIGHRVRAASLLGAQVMCVNVIDYDFNFKVTHKEIVAPLAISPVLAGIAKALLPKGVAHSLPEAETYLKDIQPSEQEKIIADELRNTAKGTLLLGATALQHPQAAVIRALAEWIAELSGSTVAYLTDGANTAGAWLAGAVPHRTTAGAAVNKPGLDVAEQFAQGLQAYVLLGVEPEFDCANPAVARKALSNAKFVVALASFRSGLIDEHADVILPITSFAEGAGTLVNLCGEWQSFTAATTPAPEIRPAWKVLRVVANLLNVAGFDYNSVAEVLAELKQQVTKKDNHEQVDDGLSMNHFAKANGLTRITEWPIYRVDALVRRASALQATGLNGQAEIRINAKLAQSLNLQTGSLAYAVQNDTRVRLPVVLDERIPDECVLVPAGFNETVDLGASFGSIQLESA